MTSTNIALPKRGMDLLSEDSQIPQGCVRTAVNVDIDRDGQFRTRKGFTHRLSGTDFVAIGAWGKRVWVQKGNEVFWLDSRTYDLEPLFHAGSVQPVAATIYNGDVWFAADNGVWVVHAGTDVARQAPRLSTRPRVSSHDAGTLYPGTYGVAVSLIDERGIESPALWLGGVQSAGGLVFENLPVIPGAKIQIYLTTQDGDVLYAAERFDALLPRMVIGTPPKGQMCETLNLRPLPGGHAIKAKGARVYVASGDTLFFSRPFRPFLHNPAHDFVRFVGKIRFIETVDGGVFVGDDRGVWWLGGDDPESANISLVTDAVALEDSSILLPSHSSSALADGTQKPCAVWLGANGYMLGTPEGNVINLQPGRIAVDDCHRGRSVFVRRNGCAQVITLTAHYEPRALRQRLGVAQDLPQGF